MMTTTRMSCRPPPNRPVSVYLGLTQGGTRRGGALEPQFMWGFDYNFTNYDLRKALELLTNTLPEEEFQGFRL